MDGVLMATSFAQKPLHQPIYSFWHVPSAARDLEGSYLQRVTNREHMNTAERLCKEATRRRPGGNGGSKPSLEYLADRLDIDDFFLCLVVRTAQNPNNTPNWLPGVLQGFITVTTFTGIARMMRRLNLMAPPCDKRVRAKVGWYQRVGPGHAIDGAFGGYLGRGSRVAPDCRNIPVGGAGLWESKW